MIETGRVVTLSELGACRSIRSEEELDSLVLVCENRSVGRRMWVLFECELGYFEDFFRFFRLKPAAWGFRFEVPGRRRWPLEARFCLTARLRPAGRRRDLLGDGLTFAAIAPSVEPIERAAVTRKSLFFAAGLRLLIFIVFS
jgi:hypothetical protein